MRRCIPSWQPAIRVTILETSDSCARNARVILQLIALHQGQLNVVMIVLVVLVEHFRSATGFPTLTW